MALDNPTLEERVEILEKELATLKSYLSLKPKRVWWQEIAGIFENDPAFEEIMTLGQSIRERERAEADS
jgi:hypothetical protein